MTRQIKSKERVVDHGEVFTADREVKAMCDLVKQETERIDSRFFEPACVDGNFLSEILSRKLDVVKKKYRKSPLDYEKNAILALSSIYGNDEVFTPPKVVNQMLDMLPQHYSAIQTPLFWTPLARRVCFCAKLPNGSLKGLSHKSLTDRSALIIFSKNSFSGLRLRN